MMVDLRERESDLEREIENFPFSGFDFTGSGTTLFPLHFFFLTVFFFSFSFNYENYLKNNNNNNKKGQT